MGMGDWPRWALWLRCRIGRRHSPTACPWEPFECCAICGADTRRRVRVVSMDRDWKALALHALSDLAYLGVPIEKMLGVDDEVLAEVEREQRNDTSYS